ncbi:MAG TPA: glycoside hydrolase family 43 protein [Hymenobacter sp.]|uniref:glycoside hydrolase family 43 protein n=1 Tax=Hymenobacter sp. TaxID=1898978 RepID=UPI002D7EABA8|nr:glycoside hydrolase family 43 protein [Hymenobacter sp.]HET9505554.1 glycoside hydrolase family 43 protein [Hymenobacter sp.]
MALPFFHPWRFGLAWLLAGALPGCQRLRPVAAATFTNPLLPSGPDPWVVQRAGYYYFLATTGGNITIRKTARMAELGAAPAVVVWAPRPGTPNGSHIWAPELHWLAGKWYIYYTAGPAGERCCGGQRAWVLENASPDPTTGTWVEKARLASPSRDLWAIDLTVFELRHRRYAVWSGQEAGSDQQNLYISAMRNPWTLTGPRICLSQPTLPWELHGLPKVNEGPEVVQHGGKVFIVYSASHCGTDDYALGLLTLSGRDPLVAAAWTKAPAPLLVQSPASHAYGPGHSGFFTSKDGTQSWLIYHANSRPGEGCGDRRSPRMQQFFWNADGSPRFGPPAEVGVPLPRPAGE